jgi:hypothetical protein
VSISRLPSRRASDLRLLRGRFPLPQPYFVYFLEYYPLQWARLFVPVTIVTVSPDRVPCLRCRSAQTYIYVLYCLSTIPTAYLPTHCSLPA